MNTLDIRSEGLAPAVVLRILSFYPDQYPGLANHETLCLNQNLSLK